MPSPALYKLRPLCRLKILIGLSGRQSSVSSPRVRGSLKRERVSREAQRPASLLRTNSLPSSVSTRSRPSCNCRTLSCNSAGFPCNKAAGLSARCYFSILSDLEAASQSAARLFDGVVCFFKFFEFSFFHCVEKSVLCIFILTIPDQFLPFPAVVFCHLSPPRSMPSALSGGVGCWSGVGWGGAVRST